MPDQPDTFTGMHRQADPIKGHNFAKPDMGIGDSDDGIAESWGYPLQELYHLNPTGHAQLASGLYNFMLPLFTPTGPSSVAPVPAPV